MHDVRWSHWERLEESPIMTPRVLGEILDGGQAFRWTRLDERTWTGVWGPFVARVRLGAAGGLEGCAPAGRERETLAALRHYLAVDGSPESHTDLLPWRSDPVLRGCVEAFPHLRILRQPFAETLLCFLCSATKQIVQIKQMVALLAERFGEQILPGIHQLPTWATLARLPERELRGCQLGFRALYIHQTALHLAGNPGWLEATRSLPYAEARERLCTLPGVGEKVADCVLLFGAGRMEAFPVDVWILKTMARRYGLEAWKPAQIAHFGRTHFGPASGLAQQYLFAWEREQARRNRT